MPTRTKKASISRRSHKRVAGDKIAVDNRGNRNAIAAGRNALATVFNIDIRDLKWQPVVVVLVVVGALLSVILWFVIPKKTTRFHSQFNVAIAQFRVVDENGRALNSKDGYALAESIRQQIITNFKEIQLDKVTSNEVWGPDQTGVITDEAQARAFALATDATIVVYGQIIEAGTSSTFSPQFYVNSTGFKEAGEITGEYGLGSQLEVNLRADMPLLQNPGLQGRINGLDMLTIGLAYYSIDDFQNALVYFQKADNANWIGSGKETVYLLIGNAYIRQASKMQDFSTLSLADKEYQDALDVNPNYGRALIGKANILYLDALTLNSCDPAGLNIASNLLDQALALKDQPASANIETKVHFYRGQIAIIRDNCHIQGTDWLTVAQQEFTWVTDQYETRRQNQGDYQGIETFASHAYARLSYVAYQRNNKDAAISLLQKAIPISSPFYKGEYTSFLGDICAATGSKEQAIQYYQSAIAIAQGNGDPQSVKRYQQKLQAVSGQ